MTTAAANTSRRRTPLSAYGAPGVWLFASALVIALVMIVLLLGAIGVRGLQTFWPGPVERIELATGEVLMGVPVRTAAYEPSADESDRFAAISATGDAIEGAFASDGRPLRRLYRVGNRDLGQEPFRWIPLPEVRAIDRPAAGTLLERTGWGVFVGRPEALLVDGERTVEGAEATLSALGGALDEARDRRAQIERLRDHSLGAIDRKLTKLRLEVRRAELAAERAERPDPLSGGARWGLWVGLMAFAAGAFWFARRLAAGGSGAGSRRWMGLGLACLGAVAAVGAATEHPWANAGPSAEELASIRAAADERRLTLEADYTRVLAQIDAIRGDDARYRLVIEDVSGVMAPESAERPDEPMRVSQVVRIVAPNNAGFGDLMGVYLSRWWEFLTDEPRASNTEGGIFPVIFGTVTLTLLLAVAVAPLGVIGAIYLREYARQGVVTSLVRIAVNNLAGVPSIVYGVFGLGFFCYTLGRYVDEGPAEPMATLPWWFTLGGAALMVWTAIGLAIAARPRPGAEASSGQAAARWVMGLAWLGAVALLATAAATTPYFEGFFRAQSAEGSPTFGTRGILWASLTLALLTLPVVIVATEEAISAVPRSMREGSYGCGASRWQTIRRIVLPGAGPGILTGMILAMARGAGEVAPLMLVGAVKLAPELPVSSEPPFVHGERSFMHLGFHIYDLGFQSPDAQAAEGLVWSTTLVLVALVFVLNLSAFVLRGRLRARLRTSAV